MRSVPATSQDLLALRLEWLKAPKATAQRFVVLSTFTADPLVPYLGTFLGEAGLAAQIEVRPAGQIMQELMSEQSVTAAARPEAIILVARFEETADPGEIESYVDAAISAVSRWQSCLILVLPPPSLVRPLGVGDDMSPDGQHAIRERLRARVAGMPFAYAVDLQAVLSGFTSAQAHASDLYALAKIPYTEPVFATLAHRIARLLRVRHFGPVRGVTVDVDRLLLTGEQDPAEVASVLRFIRAHDIRIALHSSLRPEQQWPILSARHPRLAGELADDVTGDEAAGYVWLTAEGQVVATRHVALPGDPRFWLATLDSHGIFDRVDRTGAGSAGPAPTAMPAATLDQYLRGLNVMVHCRLVRPAELGLIADLHSRAKDFTLGPAPLAGGPDTTTLAITVTDRLGDYGVSGVVSLRFTDESCVLETFSVSCPVLGKRVEDAVFEHILGIALSHAATNLKVRFTATGRNNSTANFLTAIAQRHSFPLHIDEV